MGQLGFLSGEKKWDTAAKTVPSAVHLTILISTVISTIATIRLQCDSAASGNIFQFSPFFRLLFLSLFFAPPNPPPPPLLLPSPPPPLSVHSPLCFLGRSVGGTVNGYWSDSPW